MPRRSDQDGTPRQWLVAGLWPTGEFAEDAPEAVVYAVEIARALDEALRGQNKSAVAQEARVQRAVLYRMLDGTSWPDTLSVAKLELSLGRSLWPSDPPALRRQKLNEADSL